MNESNLTLDTLPFDTGRKLHPPLECFVDEYVYKIVKPLSLFFREFNVTPNDITTLSLISGLIGLVFLYRSIKCIECSHLSK